MSYGEATAQAPTMPVNAALSTVLDQLQRCESLARSIRTHLHGDRPETASNPSSSLGKDSTPPNASAVSNTLSNRLNRLGDALDEINSSF